MTRLLPLLAIVATLALPAFGQQANPNPALLVADNVLVENGDRLIASGNVEALHDGIRLRAGQIIYDGTTGGLEITGPIRLTDENGTVMIADYAELDDGLRNGLLVGARIVLDQQLQLASVEARRIEGRFTQLSKVAVTSCQVCADQKTPLWQIRAARVVHDTQERQLYFDQAQLRVMDVPVFYLPHLRLPDPTLKRARGFLFPLVRSSTRLGLGMKIPYFIPIGDHQDITLTPYLTPNTRTLGFRYRRAFHNGDLRLSGAVSDDTLVPDTLRGYFLADGQFDLKRDYKLRFDIKAVSDISYMNDYSLSTRDRLDSEIAIERFGRDRMLLAELVHFQSLRASENNNTLPTVVADVTWERRFFPRLGGEFRINAQSHGHMRWSTRPTDGTDLDSVVDGRDVVRMNVDLSWRKRWTLMGGLRSGVTSHLWLDKFRTVQDDTTERDVQAATPGLAVELRLPLSRKGADGSKTLLEPVLMGGWVGGQRLGNANDESTRVEFDEGNLLALNRFPSADRREHGLTAAAGMRLLHHAPEGWTAALNLGRVWREEADADFSLSSGLSGTHSQWLVAGQIAHPTGWQLSARGLLGDGNGLSKAEARTSYHHARFDLGASYLFLTEDLAEDRDKDVSEWTVDGTYRVDDYWSTSLNARYDVADQRLDRTGFGLQYQNDCIQVNLSATRNFASAINLEPFTDYDLTVALKGFGTGGSAKEYRRTCAF